MALREIILPADTVPASLEFRPVYQTAVGDVGQIPHNFGSPFWRFRYRYNPMKPQEAYPFEAALDDAEGIHIFNLHDPSRPYPQAYAYAIKQGAPESIVPDAIMRGMNRAARIWQVEMLAGDTITVGDPLAFLDPATGKRLYTRARATVVAFTAGEKDIPVSMRPRYTATDMSIPCERVRPGCWFQVDLNDGARRVNPALLHDFTLNGTEHVGTL